MTAVYPCTVTHPNTWISALDEFIKYNQFEIDHLGVVVEEPMRSEALQRVEELAIQNHELKKRIGELERCNNDLSRTLREANTERSAIRAMLKIMYWDQFTGTYKIFYGDLDRIQNPTDRRDVNELLKGVQPG